MFAAQMKGKMYFLSSWPEEAHYTSSPFKKNAWDKLLEHLRWDHKQSEVDFLEEQNDRALLDAQKSLKIKFLPELKTQEGLFKKGSLDSTVCSFILYGVTSNFHC